MNLFTRIRPFAAALLLAGLQAASVVAQPGSIDPTFNPDDIGNCNGDGGRSGLNDAVVLPDGKVLITGYIYYNGTPILGVLRLTSDGKVDPLFDHGTGIGPMGGGYAILRQSDGKILLAGSFNEYNGASRNGIVRIEADGGLDPTFDPGTGADFALVNCMALQPDGKLIIGGWFTSFDGVGRNHIARLYADGSLDPTFDPGLGADNIVETIVLQSDGRIVIGGQFNTYDGTARRRIARLESDGSLDATFDPGSGASSDVYACAVLADGRMLIGGRFTSYNGTSCGRIARLESNGDLDPTFISGAGANGEVRTLLEQPDGAIMIGGSFLTYDGIARKRIARLLANGTVDTQFVPGQGASGGVISISMLPDGRYILTGDYYFTSYASQPCGRIARIGAAGAFDPTFNAGTGANAQILGLALRADGKILLCGGFTEYNNVKRKYLARANTDGSLDIAFDPGASANMLIHGALPLPNNKVLIHGQFTSFDGESRNRIARLNADGSLDMGFQPGTGANGDVTEALLQPDGKLLIAGDFTYYNGTACGHIVRLNANGTRDVTFTTAPGANARISDLLLQPDGRIVVSGEFTSYNGTPHSLVARIMPDGSLDPSFSVGIGPDVIVEASAYLPDGRILMAGGFHQFGGVTAHRVARLLSDGSTDATFSAPLDLSWEAVNLVVQNDGGIVVTFKSFTFAGAADIVRLLENGAVDPLFNVGAGFDTGVFGGEILPLGLALQPDGKILVGGNFVHYNGIGRNRIIRLQGVSCVTGTPCDDGDPNTLNDTLNAACDCVGIPDPACPPTQLTTTADPVISCGATDLKFDGTSIIAATEVPGANKYQFLFTNVTGQPLYARSIAFATPAFILTKWYTLPLKAGRTYNVTVRASFDNGATWCAYGPSCTVKMSWFPLPPGQQPRSAQAERTDEPELLLYPNPTSGENLRISLIGVDPELTTVSLDITDLFGKRVMSSTLPINDGELNSVLSLDGDLADGLYILTITAGEQVFNERVVINR